jgi:hypothetical protein
MNLPEALEYVPRFPEPMETVLAYLSLDAYIRVVSTAYLEGAVLASASFGCSLEAVAK